MTTLSDNRRLDGTLFKVGYFRDRTIVPFRYGNTFQNERTTGPERIRIGTGDDHLSLLRKLAFAVSEPFFVLYLLHTSLCGSRLGRYQSPAIPFVEVNAFMAEFGEFLTNDSRHDLWLHSPGSDATLVWDRDNLIYAYGPLEQFRTILKEGFQQANVDGPPIPHTHMYHPENNESERKILRYFEWTHTPLEDGDKQV